MLILILLASLPMKESLLYRVKYGPVTAGEISLELERDSSERIIIKCKQWTTGIISAMFKADNWHISISDSNFVTEEFEKNIKEGRYESYQHLKIRDGFATYNKGATIEVIPNAKDIINVWFWLRTQELSAGKSIIVPLHADKKNHEIKVNIKKEKKGKKTYTVVIPELKGIKAFGSDGELIFYYDELMVPVEFKIKFLWGYLNTELKERKWVK